MTDVVETADGVFKASCPYCGKSFSGESELEVLKKEGNHRIEHVDTESNVVKKTHNRNVGRKGNKSVVNGISG